MPRMLVQIPWFSTAHFGRLAFPILFIASHNKLPGGDQNHSLRSDGSSRKGKTVNPHERSRNHKKTGQENQPKHKCTKFHVARLLITCRPYLLHPTVNRMGSGIKRHRKPMAQKVASWTFISTIELAHIRGAGHRLWIPPAGTRSSLA